MEQTEKVKEVKEKDLTQWKLDAESASTMISDVKQSLLYIVDRSRETDEVDYGACIEMMQLMIERQAESLDLALKDLEGGEG